MNVFVLDESLELAVLVGRLAPLRGWQPHFVGSLHELEMAIRAHGRPALVVVNLQAPLTAWELGQRLRGLESDSPVVVLGPRGTADAPPPLPGVQWLERPAEEAELTAALGRVVSRLGLGGRRLGAGSGVAAHGLIGQSPQLAEVLAKIEKVAAGDANVCISGESGTGKELIARAIHEQSPRADRPLVTLDCTAIPEGLMESHLFGHVRGSFTGAVEHRTGFFALAHTGTLFIDEISELSMPLQAKAAAGDPDAGVREVGGSSRRGRTSADHGEQQGFAAGGAGGAVSGGSVLPDRGGDDRGAAAAGAAGGHWAAGGAFSAEVCGGAPQAGAAADGAGAGAAAGGGVAGQCAAAGELHRAGGGIERA